MRQIELYPGVYSSAIGFGCGPILGSVDKNTAIRAIEVAIDHGINHFDLARSYGYGEAEKFVGRRLCRNRDAFRIATKFGIHANWKARLLSPMKPVARKLRKHLVTKPSGTNPFLSSADRFHDRLPISSEAMTRSLDTSLRALGTDYIDYFFVHEPLETIHEFESVFLTADRLRQAGKIRCFGLATPKLLDGTHDAYVNRFNLLQFARPATSQEYMQVVAERGGEPNILFSPFRNTPPGQRDVVIPDLLKDFKRSVILCSMFNPCHIIANHQAASIHDT